MGNLEGETYEMSIRWGVLKLDLSERLKGRFAKCSTKCL